MVSIAAPFFFTTNPAHLCALAVAILVSRKYGLAWTVADLRGYSGGAWALAWLTPPSIHAAGTSEPSC